MSYIRISARNNPTFQQQATTNVTQANPVSATLYSVLATTSNVRILAIEARVTWAVTQPTILEVLITIDGNVFIARVDNPVSNTVYKANLSSIMQIGRDLILVTSDEYQSRAFLLEGRSIKVDARVTWAITQPTFLECYVVHAKR